VLFGGRDSAGRLNRNDLELRCAHSGFLGVTHGDEMILTAHGGRACRFAGTVASGVGGITALDRRRDDGRMRHFVDDDAGYLDWLGHHPDGFVINTVRDPSPSYLMLHRPSCWTISRLQPRATTFTGEYIKICGTRGELSAHARALGGEPQACGHCLK
jgi:hypothetical protein